GQSGEHVGRDLGPRQRLLHHIRDLGKCRFAIKLLGHFHGQLRQYDCLPDAEGVIEYEVVLAVRLGGESVTDLGSIRGKRLHDMIVPSESESVKSLAAEV